jgi:hypothetical protein
VTEPEYEGDGREAKEGGGRNPRAKRTFTSERTNERPTNEKRFRGRDDAMCRNRIVSESGATTKSPGASPRVVAGDG